MPSNDLTPAIYRKHVEKLAKTEGWQLTFIDSKALKRKKAGAFLGCHHGGARQHAALSVGHVAHEGARVDLGQRAYKAVGARTLALHRVTARAELACRGRPRLQVHGCLPHGGDESALFAGDLVRMYLRFCERRGWRTEIMSESAAELGGYKELVLRVEGTQAYGGLRFESGGHRVQRVPETEGQGRIHTSMATVAVRRDPRVTRTP